MKPDKEEEQATWYRDGSLSIEASTVRYLADRHVLSKVVH
jgi:hypothetical protein